MVRWLEANSYDVTYFTDVDTDRNGSLILNHKIWLSNGHDEYWSGNQRAKVEAARDAGVHLAFFSGNTTYWKTRWESSIDGAGVPYRTLVCYKETWEDAVFDPNDPPTWTGTWRDPRFSPPADGGRPENALIGALSRIVGSYTDDIIVPQSDGRMRFWRNTAIATLNPGQTVTLAPGSLGAELHADEDNGFRPAGLFHLTTTTVFSTNNFLLDYGSTVGPGTMTHNLTLYRHSSGSLVFNAGTYGWAWGLDANHDRQDLGQTTDVAMQQATVNLFADMGVQPATLQPGLVAATASTDHAAPNSSFTAPSTGSSVTVNTIVTITGTAVDSGGGVVGGVEISTDGGTTWHPAIGRESWSYSWKPTTVGSTIIKSRAVDDSGNLETTSAGMGVTVVAAAPPCPTCGFWSDSMVPGVVDGGPDSPVELGLQFRPTVNGTITGVQFYKASTNTGTHVANLWSSNGTLLATATFTAETASGWQQVLFSSPVAVTANTVYTVSYHAANGHYSADQSYFPTTGADNSSLQAIAGVYGYGATSNAPTQTYNGTNYWVDPLFNAGQPPTLSSIAVTPATPTISTGSTQQFIATGTYSNSSTQNLTSQVAWASASTSVATINSAGLATAVNAGSTTISATLGTVAGSTTLTVQTTPLTITTASLPGGSLNVVYTATLAASGGVTPYTWSLDSGALPTGLSLTSGTGVISGIPTAIGTFSFTARVTAANGQSVTKPLSIIIVNVVTLWPGTAVPGLVDGGADSPVELGVKFRSDVNGSITGIRFYKASTNTGTHVANLWTSSGTRLTTATFTGETASGWQQVLFSSPVPITANTVYVVSYHANSGHYSADVNYFATTGVDSPPLHALANGVSGGNGVYRYGSTSGFPTQTWNASNYWVDVVFSSGPAPTLSSIAVTPATPTISTGSTQQFTATGTYSNSSTQNLTSQVAWASASTSVATINSAGLATAVNAGSTTISATLGTVAGSTTLTVQTTPLTITTASLPGGSLNVVYTATLAASGGVTPYTWSLDSGALPTGLSLTSGTGVISGIPTAIGTFSFTARVTAANGQSVTKPLSIIIVNVVTLWPGTAVPGLVDGGADSPVELGVKFRSDVNGSITGIRFYKASTNTGTHVANLWTSSGTRLTTATFTGETASGWQQVLFSSPVPITANTVYVVSYHANSGHYSADVNYFATTGVDSPPLHALANGVSGGNGVYAYGSTSLFPTQTWFAANYWVDVVFQP